MQSNPSRAYHLLSKLDHISKKKEDLSPTAFLRNLMAFAILCEIECIMTYLMADFDEVTIQWMSNGSSIKWK